MLEVSRGRFHKKSFGILKNTGLLYVIGSIADSSHSLRMIKNMTNLGAKEPQLKEIGEEFVLTIYRPDCVD